MKDGLDSIETKQSDLDFQVSTKTTNVRDFLDAPFDSTKVVFSTYQSAWVIGKALNPGEAFDLAVFDEAHKTAGREGRNFAFALEDANLPIRKRLFLTATPRHYNPHQQNREGEAQLVFSMDRPDVYGPQAFILTFAEAARRGIICGYKVIISVITSEMVTNELLRRGDVLVNGDAVRARQVANQIALRDAIEKYGARKAFTFHKTVASAESFVADGSEGIRTHLPEFQTFHVNGTMLTARRERQMRDFRAADRAVMSNARCLTEGVDVPAVDMVAFLSPRRSRVDIVQATGRAMRRSPGKTTGYVLVPLFVEQAADESVEAAVSRTDFDEVWDVLHSLQEQDDVLAELIRNMGEQKGRGKGFDDSGFADRVDIAGLQIGLDELRAAVATRCFESLFSSWDTYFGKLVAFKERFGHCNVETGWEEDPSFASWVMAQRTRRTKGALSDQQIARMDSLGFVWDWQTLKANENWMEWYRKLKAYSETHGNPHVPRTYTDKKLASWVWIQRQRRRGKNRAGPLSNEQISQLDKLGFRWDARGEKWQEGFEKLKQFKEKHGHCEVGLMSGEDDLLSWVRQQRSLKAHGKLDAERQAQLNAFGFSWVFEMNDHRWDEMYQRLKNYHAQHGNADVPHRWKEDMKLAAWVGAQRQKRKKALMSGEQVHLLDDLGFTWQHRERGSWEERLAEVAAFKAKNGHCDIPTIYPENPKLGRFVNAMRTDRNKGALSAERIAKLDEVGFVWASGRATIVDGEGISADWQARFEELLRFKATHGHCDVPGKWDENPKLGNWVNFQRYCQKSGTLHPERKQRLEEVGFNWISERSSQDSWGTRYEQLKAYQTRFGHCRVPVEWLENKNLGAWVIRQRFLKKSGKLTQDREEMLNELGFTWEERERSSWDARFRELVEFKAQNGHFDVPVKWSENPQLGAWVAAQRALGKSGKLSPERCQHLDSIEFDWRSDSRQEEWTTRYDQLKAYKDRFGDCRVPVKWPENEKLGAWVARQRHFFKHGKLPSEKVRLLNDVGFE